MGLKNIIEQGEKEVTGYKMLENAKVSFKELGLNPNILEDKTIISGSILSDLTAESVRQDLLDGLDLLNVNRVTIGYANPITNAATAETARLALVAQNNKAEAVDVLNTNKGIIGYTANIVDANTANAAIDELEDKSKYYIEVNAAKTAGSAAGAKAAADLATIPAAAAVGHLIAAVETLNENNGIVGYTGNIIDVTTANAAIIELEANNNKAKAVDVLNTNKVTIGFTTDIIDVTTAGAARTELERNEAKANAYDTINTAAIATGAGNPNLDNTMPNDYAAHAASIVTALNSLAAHCETAGNGDANCLAACQAGFHFNGWVDADAGASGFQCI